MYPPHHVRRSTGSSTSLPPQPREMSKLPGSTKRFVTCYSPCAFCFYSGILSWPRNTRTPKGLMLYRYTSSLCLICYALRLYPRAWTRLKICSTLGHSVTRMFTVYYRCPLTVKLEVVVLFCALLSYTWNSYFWGLGGLFKRSGKWNFGFFE